MEFTHCGLRLWALFNVGRPLSLKGNRNKLQSNLHKWPLYLSFLEWYKNAKLGCKNRHHCWIHGVKSCQPTINLAPFWHHQNLDPRESQRFPKRFLPVEGLKIHCSDENLSIPLCSLWNSEKIDYKVDIILPLSKISLQGNLKIPQASKNILARFFL